MMMTDDTQGEVAQPARREYGLMKVLYRKRGCVITLGPDYCFFMCAFSFFCLAAFTVLAKVLSHEGFVFLKVIAAVACIGQPTSYLLAAFSNPGVVISQPDVSNIDKSKFCKVCRFNVEKSTYHCPHCDVCIEGYDHHCPWVSKCIGKNNLKAFYLFLTMTPCFFIVTMLTFATTQ